MTSIAVSTTSGFKVIARPVMDVNSHCSRSGINVIRPTIGFPGSTLSRDAGSASTTHE